MQLQGQTALVTGASHGLGRAIALALAVAGAQVALLARDGAALNVVATEIERRGGAALVICCDVRDDAAVAAAVARAQAELGPVDTVVTSAGVGLRKAAAEITAAEWSAVFDTLVRGTFLVAQAALPAMIERKRGNIVTLAAPLERIELPGFAAYTAAKYAVAGLTKTLAKELRRYSINVNGVHPGGFARTALVEQMIGTVEHGLVDPGVIGPLVVALAAQTGRGVTGAIIDPHSWPAGLVAAEIVNNCYPGHPRPPHAPPRQSKR